jgi:hypothetical protein
MELGRIGFAMFSVDVCQEKQTKLALTNNLRTEKENGKEKAEDFVSNVPCALKNPRVL